MKRYFLSPIVGTGSLHDPYRPRIADFSNPASPLFINTPFSLAPLMPPSNPDGSPSLSWCLCVVAGPNHAPLVADGPLGNFPDFPLDAKVSALQASTRIAMIAMLGRQPWNLPAASIVTKADGFRDVINQVGQVLQPSFDSNNFDVGEPLP